jgi:hypothetical protein
VNGDQRWKTRAGAVLWRAFSLAVFLSGMGLAAYAGVQWLQTAHWQPLTLNGVLTGWPATRDWVAHPRAWLGLHRVVTWLQRVPVFVIVMVLGGVLLAVSPPFARSPTWQDRW